MRNQKYKPKLPVFFFVGPSLKQQIQHIFHQQEEEISINVTLVHLVNNDVVKAFQHRVRLQLTEQDSSGAEVNGPCFTWTGRPTPDSIACGMRWRHSRLQLWCSVSTVYNGLYSLWNGMNAYSITYLSLQTSCQHTDKVAERSFLEKTMVESLLPCPDGRNTPSNQCPL